MWITPNYQDTDFVSPMSLDDKITVFLDRTHGWQLDIADQLANGKRGPNGEVTTPPVEHSGLAVLHVVLSYFEMIAKYQDGFARTARSEHYFGQGVYAVFPELRSSPSDTVDSLLRVLYAGARCGLYHSGMPDSRIVLTGEIQSALAFDGSETRLVINPHLLVTALKAHLEAYGAELRDSENSGSRAAFERRFDYDASRS